MSVTFDGPNKLIIADAGTTQLDVAEDIYSAWKTWASDFSNMGYAQALRVVGGDPTVGGNRIAGYFFLMNGWRLRPQEANHTLVLNGILLVDGGGDPFVSTIGDYNVRINQTTPLQAESVLVETGTSGLTEQESNRLQALEAKLAEVWALHGLDPDHSVEVTRSKRVAGNVQQDIATTGKGNSQKTVIRRST